MVPVVFKFVIQTVTDIQKKIYFQNAEEHQQGNANFTPFTFKGDIYK